MKQKTIAIIHFNTPELTEACILSIRKHGCDWPVVVFDNSREVTWPAGEGMPERTLEAHPFTRRMKGVKALREGALDAYDTVLIRMRWNNVVTRDSRLQHGGVTYQIQSLHADRQENTIQITATEIVK